MLVSIIETRVDICLLLSYIHQIPLTKGRLPEACREVGRVRCSRADLQSALGRLGHHVSRHYDRGGRCSLDWDRRRRVTPVQTTSQEAWPEAEPLG